MRFRNAITMSSSRTVVTALSALLFLCTATAQTTHPLAEKLQTAITAGDAAAVDAMQAPAFTDHAPPDGVLPGPARLSAPYYSLRAAFPDLRLENLQVATAADRLVLSYVLTGHHGAPYAGIAPRQRAIHVPGYETWRLRDGRVTERFLLWDRMSLLQQITDPVADGGRAAPTDATLLSRFAPPMFLESVLVHPQLGVLVTDMVGGRVLRVDAAGTTTEFFHLPATPQPGMNWAMCLAAVADGVLLTVISPDMAVHGVWHVATSGAAQRRAALPPGTMPNGIAVMDNGAALVADSFGARLWHVDTAGNVRLWLEHPLLQPRAFLGRFPGPNGVQVWNGNAYVAVSDRGHIVRVPITGANDAGEPQVLYADVAADDFAIDADGTMYFATHPFDTIMRVDGSGKRSILAGTPQGITGPTAVALARDSAGSKVLYAVTDGGLYRKPGTAPIPVPQQVPGLYRLSLR